MKKAICLGGGLTVAITLAQAISAPKSVAQCKPSEAVAEVISTGDSVHPRNALLCRTDSIQPLKNRMVTISCRETDAILYGAYGSISTLCQSSKKKTTEKTTHGWRANKQRTRLNTRGAYNTIGILQRPFGHTLLSPQPRLAWESVPKASAYEVEITGYNFQWQATVEGTTLDYPESAPPLLPRRIYKVMVLAVTEGEELSLSAANYSVVSPDIAGRVRLENQKLDQLGLPISETALRRDQIYMAHSLLNKSIESLEHAIENGADNRVKRLLAKRYQDAGFPELGQLLFSNNDGKVIANYRRE